MVDPESIQSHIAQKLSCTHLNVIGDGHHFEAIIVSEAFINLTRIKRHQLIYQALGDRMREEIHALSMKTYTPAEWHTITKKN